jgi:hypothetical protein
MALKPRVRARVRQQVRGSGGGGGPPSAIYPTVITPATIEHTGVEVGDTVNGVPATFSDAVSVVSYWWLDVNPTWRPWASYNPLDLPPWPGEVLRLITTATSSTGHTTDSVSDPITIEEATTDPEYVTEYGEPITVKAGATRGSEGVANMLTMQFRFLKEGWLDGFRFVKHASDPTTSRAYRVWDYPTVGTTSGALLVSGNTSGEATGSEHVEEVIFSSPLVYDTIGEIVEVGYQAPNPGWVIAKTEEYNSDKTHGNVVTRGYGAGSNGPNGNGRYQATALIVQPNESWYNSDYFIRPIFRSLAGDDPPPPPPDGYPDATNTGTTGALTNSSRTSYSTPGELVEDMNITGNVSITAANVTFRNCKITATSLYHTVMVSATGFIMEDCEIDGANGTAKTGVYINGTNYSSIIRRCNIHGVENGIDFNNFTTIERNYIWGFSGAPGAHFDGIEANGGHDIIIRENTVWINATQTSGIMLNNYFRGMYNVLVEGNKIVGGNTIGETGAVAGSYPIYCDNSFSGGPIDGSTVIIRNNTMQNGSAGPVAYMALYSSGAQHYGNTDWETGAAID